MMSIVLFSKSPPAGEWDKHNTIQLIFWADPKNQESKTERDALHYIH